MEWFERFLRERRVLEIEEARLREVLNKLLSEFNLTLLEAKRVSESRVMAVCRDRFGKEVKVLVELGRYGEIVEAEELEDLYEDLLAEGGHFGIYLTPASFSREAQKFAKHMPLRLVDGKELATLVGAAREFPVEGAFVSGVDDRGAVRHFRSHFKRISELERRYLPLAHFRLRIGTEWRDLYIDLTSFEALRVEAMRIERVPYFRKISRLKAEERAMLAELLRRGETKEEELDPKTLAALQREGLVKTRLVERPGLMGTLMDSVFGTERRYEEVEKEHKVRATSGPWIDLSYNLGHFYESSTRVSSDYTPDEALMSPEEVEELRKTLEAVYDARVEFTGVVYMPYYRCKYSGREGYQTLCELRSKFLEARVGAIEVFIDRYPALPYLILAFVFILLNLEEMERVVSIFSLSFLFLLATLGFGIALKAIFRTERMIPRYGSTVLRFGFPSIHAMLAFGLVALLLFFDPLLSVVAFVLAFIYGASRIRMGVHTIHDVLGGAIAGALIGGLIGYFGPKLELPLQLNLVFAVALLISLLVATLVESKLR